MVPLLRPGRVAQSVGHLTRNSEVLGSIPGLATYFRFFLADSRGAVVSYWQKPVHEVLVYRLGGLSLSRKSVVRLNDFPNMTLDVYHGRKTTTTVSQSEARSTVAQLKRYLDWMNTQACRLSQNIYVITNLFITNIFFSF